MYKSGVGYLYLYLEVLKIIYTSVLYDTVAMSCWFLYTADFCSRASKLKLMSSGLCLNQAFKVAGKDVFLVFLELWPQVENLHFPIDWSCTWDSFISSSVEADIQPSI